MRRRSALYALAAVVLVRSPVFLSPVKSTVYPYTITPPAGFKYVVLVDSSGRKVDYFFPALGSFVTNINIYAVRGTTIPDGQTYLRLIGAAHVHKSGLIQIMGRKVPLMLGDFRGFVGRWTLEQTTLVACGLTWRLTVSYDVKYVRLRSTMLHAVQTFRVTCASSH